MTTQLALLISGNSAIITGLLDAIRQRVLDAQIVLIISPSELDSARGQIAKAGIPLQIMPFPTHHNGDRREQAEEANLIRLLESVNPDWVILGGWSHHLSDALLQKFAYRVLRLYPTLPEQLLEIDAVAQGFKAGQRRKTQKVAVTVYLVTDGQTNRGPVLSSEEILIYPHDTLEMLGDRLPQMGTLALIHALRRVVDGDDE